MVDYTMTVGLRQRSEVSGMLHSLEETARTGATPAVAVAAVTGKTESRLGDVRTYSVDEPFIVGVNGVVAVTDTHVEYTAEGITFVTEIETGDTTYYIGVGGLNNDNSVLMDVVKRESDPFVGKSDTVDAIDIDRAEFSVFQSMYRLANIDSLDDLNNYF